MNLNIFIISIVLLNASGVVKANNPNKLRLEVEVINEKIENLFISENVSALVELYSDRMTFFPEYQPAILERQQLGKFFTSWFKDSDIKSYKKKIYEVQSISNYILEIGTFNTNYTSKLNSDQQFKGKYMVLWIRDDRGNLSIKSEAFGASQYVEPANVPYADVRIDRSDSIEEHKISHKLQIEIEEFNAIVIKAVAEGNSEVRAKGFTEDGIYMPPFDSLKVGMEAIEEHMRKTYKPGISYVVKHNYFRIFELGDYIFINAHYTGTWGDLNNGGKFGGNMSNLMKRSRNGKLLMHRQLSNREF